MSTLKSLKLKIDKSSTIKQITSAMQLVSAAKTKSSKHVLAQSRDCSIKSEKLLDLLCAVNERDVLNHNLMKERPIQTRMILGIGSDKGLCGSFNAGIAKEISAAIESCLIRSESVIVRIVGSRLYQAILAKHKDLDIELIYHSANEALQDVPDLLSDLSERFLSYQISVCQVIYAVPVNVLVQTPICMQLLPIERKAPSNDSLLETATRRIYLSDLEPSISSVLSALLPVLLSTRLHSAFFNHSLAEHMARMNAMDTATKNAEEIISETRVLYNRMRQAAITTELVEIISGSEALKG